MLDANRKARGSSLYQWKHPKLQVQGRTKKNAFLWLRNRILVAPKQESISGCVEDCKMPKLEGCITLLGSANDLRHLKIRPHHSCQRTQVPSKREMGTKIGSF